MNLFAAVHARAPEPRWSTVPGGRHARRAHPLRARRRCSTRLAAGRGRRRRRRRPALPRRCTTVPRAAGLRGAPLLRRRRAVVRGLGRARRRPAAVPRRRGRGPRRRDLGALAVPLPRVRRPARPAPPGRRRLGHGRGPRRPRRGRPARRARAARRGDHRRRDRETAEVEAVLRDAAAGRLVVVVGVPHAELGAVLAAVLTDARPTVRRCRGGAAELTAAAAAPAVVPRRPTCPLTAAGKVDRERAGRTGRPAATAAPRLALPWSRDQRPPSRDAEAPGHRRGAAHPDRHGRRRSREVHGRRPGRAGAGRARRGVATRRSPRRRARQLHGPGRRRGAGGGLAAGLPVEVPGADRRPAVRLAGWPPSTWPRSGARRGRAWCWPGASSPPPPRRWRFWPRSATPSRCATSGRRSRPEAAGDPDMGLAADVLAEKARRHPRAAGRLRRPLARARRRHPRRRRVRRRGRPGRRASTATSAPRAGLTAERLARLRPAFRAGGGTVTAGNACGVNDGAAAVALVGRRHRTRSLGLPGLRGAGHRHGRRATRTCPASAWCRPRAGRPRAGGADARRPRRRRAQRGVRRPGARLLRRARPRPGAGLRARAARWRSGHPWGASGAVLAVRLFSQLVRGDAGALGLAAIAVGGGQGVAMVVERCR